jgi:protein-S-isoprenylcysteine O-methyltransferase Ste14
VAAGITFGALVTVLQVLPEECHLEARFAGPYLEYKARTRRWI